MNYNYTLKYRTYDSLLSDVLLDLMGMDQMNKIEPAWLIKVAMRCNYELGLRIQMTKERILEVEKGKVKLPDDFGDSGVINFASICGDHTVSTVLPQGTHTESLNPITHVVPQYTAMGQPTLCGPSSTQKVCMQWNKDQPIIIQKINTETRTYTQMFQLQFTNAKYINCDCPNLQYQCRDQAYVKDGYIWTNFDCANLYLNYEGTLEDADGNLLVPNHPLLNEYYEYALKQRIFENLALDGDDLGKQLQLVEIRLRAARNNAMSLVNTPNFSEMQKLWVTNRLAMYSKYYDMFKSYPGQMSPRVNNAV